MVKGFSKKSTIIHFEKILLKIMRDALKRKNADKNVKTNDRSRAKNIPSFIFLHKARIKK